MIVFCRSAPTNTSNGKLKGVGQLQKHRPLRCVPPMQALLMGVDVVCRQWLTTGGWPSPTARTCCTFSPSFNFWISWNRCATVHCELPQYKSATPDSFGDDTNHIWKRLQMRIIFSSFKNVVFSLYRIQLDTTNSVFNAQVSPCLLL